MYFINLCRFHTELYFCLLVCIEFWLLLQLINASAPLIQVPGTQRTYTDIAPRVMTYGKTGVAAGRWKDCRMRRDVKRRWTIKEWAPERLRVNSLRKNTILPADIEVKT